jgi:hypothetical protein
MPRSVSKALYRSRAQRWRAIFEGAPTEAKMAYLELAAACDRLADLAPDGDAQSEIEPPADAE